MKTLITIFVATAAMATVPHTLTSGSPAKASDVNDNFNYLDSTVQKKASQTNVDALSSAINGKADGSLKDSLKTRVDTGSFSAFKAKEAGDISSLNATKADISIKDSLKARVDTGSFSTLKANVASLNATIANTPTTASLKGIRDTVSSIQTSVSALQSGKADASLRDSVKARVDTGSFSAFKATEAGDILSVNAKIGVLSSSNSLSGIRDTLKSKQDALGFVPANKAGETFTGNVTVNTNLTVVGMVYAGGFQTGGNISSVGLKSDTVAAKSVTVGGNQVWHAGNLNPLFNGGVRGSDAFTDNNPPAGSWQADPGSMSTPSGPNTSHNIQVFSTGNYRRGMQIAGSYDSDNFYARRGGSSASGDVWQPWVTLVHSGNFKSMAQSFGIVTADGGTITGDLRISGKLTTNPGATPADYVFEPDYKLTTLSEVEAYTKANKHLPEVPSASEMTEKGVDIAAMNMMLLKKVEELTLHAIEQEKQAEVTTRRMEEQEARLDEQQHMINELKTAGAKQ